MLVNGNLRVAGGVLWVADQLGRNMYLFVQLLTSPFVRFSKRTLKFSAFSTSVSKVHTSMDFAAVQGKGGMVETFLGAVGPSLSFRFPMPVRLGLRLPSALTMITKSKWKSKLM